VHPAIWSLALVPLLGMTVYTYFFFGEDLVCASALPATDFVLLPVLPSRSKDDALLATALDVCLLFAMYITSFQ
jgi:hypothetical protein